jgi:hypothetical protein
MARNRASIPTNLIAPCGLNCRLCYAYNREKNPCSGCRGDDNLKSEYCITCKIKNCEKLADGKAKYCVSCSEFPCAKINRLEKRYTTKYATSVIGNLNMIKESGIKRFIVSEKERRACPRCGKLICVHKPVCLTCGCKWH